MAREQADKKQAFLFILSDQQDLKEIPKGLGNTMQRKGKSCYVALLGNQEQVDALSAQKSIKSYQGDNVLTCETGLGPAIDWIENTGVDEVYIANGQNVANLADALSEHKNTSIGEGEMAAVFPAREKKKSAIPFKNRFHNLFRQIFAGIPSKDGHNLFTGFRIETLRSLLQTRFARYNKDHSQLHFSLVKAGFCQGLRVKEHQIPFSQLNNADKGFFGGARREVVMGTKSRVTYMVGESLRDIRQNGISISRPNAGLFKLSFFILALLIGVVMPILSFGFGMTWDEPDQVRYANDILKYFFSLGENQAVFDMSKRVYGHMVNYGMFFDSFCALANKILPTDLYQTRHMFNAFSGFVGMLFAALLAREVGNWRMALIALLMFVFSPYFFGHSMNNPKDVPFASGFIMSLYFIARYLKQLPRPKTSTLVLLTLSIALVNSIRIGGLLLVAFLGLFTGLAWLITLKKEGGKHAFGLIPRYAKYVIGVGLISYILALIPWPYAHQDPIMNPYKALQSFTQFSNVTIYEIFEGERIYMNEVPWYYIPKLMWIGNPLFAIFGAVLCLLPLLWFKKGNFNKPLLWFAAFALVFPIAYAAYGGSTLYNGWRHFLFVYPATVVLSAAGWEFMLQLVRNKWVQVTVFAVLGGLIVNTAVWMVKYHPNEYVYFNELVGGYDGAYGNYELDTYGNGVRQGFEKLVSLRPEVKNKETLVGFNMTGWDWSQPSTKTFFGDSVDGKWVRSYERYRHPWDYAIFFPRTYSPNELGIDAYPPEGTVYVERIEGKPLYAIVKRENDHMLQGHKLVNKQRYAEAIPHWRNAVQYDSLNEESWRNLGLSLLNTGQLEEAKTALEKAVEIRPESHFAHSYLGMYWLRKNNINKAIEKFELAVDYKINYTFAYIQLGNMYSQAQRFTEALENYETGLERLGRPDAGILNQMGVCYLQLRNIDKAIAYFQTAIQQDPNLAGAYRNLGIAYGQKGDQQKAQQYMNKAKQLGG